MIWAVNNPDFVYEDVDPGVTVAADKIEFFDIFFKMKKCCFIFIYLFSSFVVLTACETDDDRIIVIDECIDVKQDSSSAPKEQTDSLPNMLVPQWALCDSLRIKKIELYMNHSGVKTSMQGGDTYNGFFFQFQDKNAHVYIYDLEKKNLLQTIDLTPVSMNHCNNASFSRIFYDSHDEFPLLYVSNGNISSYNRVQVYRITRADSLFNISKVQEFVLPDATKDNYLYATDVVMDNCNNFMYVTSKGETNLIETGRVCKYNIPDPHNDGIFALRESCIIDSFYMPRLEHHQGAMIVGTKMYIVAGVPHWGTPPELVVVDMEKRKLVQRIDLRDYGYNIEPEAIFLYKDTLYISSNRRGVHRVLFDNN